MNKLIVTPSVGHKSSAILVLFCRAAAGNARKLSGFLSDSKATTVVKEEEEEEEKAALHLLVHWLAAGRRCYCCGGDIFDIPERPGGWAPLHREK